MKGGGESTYLAGDQLNIDFIKTNREFIFYPTTSTTTTSTCTVTFAFLHFDQTEIEKLSLKLKIQYNLIKMDLK